MRKIVFLLLSGVVAFAFANGDKNNANGKDISKNQNSTLHNDNKNTEQINQPVYIQQAYNRDYYYHICMENHKERVISVYAMAKNITNQLICSETTPINAPIGVSVIVDLNKLHQTTDFGRLLSEDLISELQRKNMSVIDIRAQTFLLINDKGEFYLSRDINNLRKKYKLGYILVGTYSVGQFNTTVNARIVDATNGFVVATAHSSIPTQIISDLLYNPPSSIPEIQLRSSNEQPNQNNISMNVTPLIPTAPVKPQTQTNTIQNTNNKK